MDAVFLLDAKETMCLKVVVTRLTSVHSSGGQIVYQVISLELAKRGKRNDRVASTSFSADEATRTTTQF